MSRLVPRRIRAGAALLLSLPLLAHGQTPPPAASPAPTPRAGVTAAEEVAVLTLDVMAVDAKNRPVYGLVAGDFEVRVAGKVQTIDFFEPPREHAALPKEGRPDSEERIAGTTTPFDSKATVRHVLVWVDLEQLSHRSIVDTASALHAALDHAPAGRYGLVTHFGVPSARVWDADSVDAILAEADRMSLEIAESTSGSAVRTRTETLSRPRGGDSPSQYEARKGYEKQLIDDMTSTQQGGGDTRLVSEAITDYLSAERRRVKASVDGLREVASRLAGLEGPRHLILMSEGFERIPGFDFLARLRAEQGARVRTASAAGPPAGITGRGRLLEPPPFPGAPGAAASLGGGSYAFDSSPLFELDDLTKWFASSGVIVHFLDPGGLGREQPSAADRYSFESKLRAEDLKNLHETALGIASDTGGLSRIATNDAGGTLAEFLDAASATYRIGVRLAGVDPKKTYSVRVATRKAGVNMLARSAFRAPGPAPQAASALAADARRAGAEARAGERRPGAARAAKKPIALTLEWKGRATTASPDPAKPFWKLEVRIPHEDLRFETESDAFVASVRIAVEASAVEGPAHDSTADDWFLSYTGEEYKEVRDTAASRLVTLQLPPGRYDLSVSVNDVLGGTFGQATLRVDAH